MKLKNLVIFAVGAVAGAAVAHVVTKRKMEEILDEEIASVKDAFKKRMEDKKESDKNVEELLAKVEEENEYVPTEEDIQQVNDIISSNGYVNYTKYMNDEEEKENEQVEATDFPYVIEPEEFGEDGYDTQTLTYYADGVLVDDLDDIVDDIETVVGIQNIKVFEEFGATSVMVRNEIFRVDYEIIKDDWNYSDLNQDVYSKEEIQEIKDEYKKEKKPHEL